MRGRTPNQYPLFDVSEAWPNGFVYQPDLITPEEEAVLLAYIHELPLKNAPFREYTAKRRVHGWWGNRTLPQWLLPITAKLAAWQGVPQNTFKNALISEYSPGTGVGWHRDAPPYEKIYGLSLAGWAQFELRPNRNATVQKGFSRTVEPRSVYIMQGESRARFQHRVVQTKTMRYSITFRT
ncbi:MAG: 2OG-Fe(II) oxygenase [Parcubacteria group bacterium]|nr:2OG-Fe(II) oxygenase [Parcubacteria group bacterium]